MERDIFSIMERRVLDASGNSNGKWAETCAEVRMGASEETGSAASNSISTHLHADEKRVARLACAGDQHQMIFVFLPITPATGQASV